MNFGEMVKLIRSDLGITQEQLARDLSISFSTINRWENGHTVPSKLGVMRLVDYCLLQHVNDAIITELREL